MQISLITLFPEMFAALDYGIVSRAIKRKLVTLSYWNPRDFSLDKHRNIDDRPYGGGPGMVMKFQPLYDAIQMAKQYNPSARVIYLSPQGRVLNQSIAAQLALLPGLVLLNGRYEGIDERLIETKVVDEEYSIGDYVISGAEFASLVLIDTVVRCIPGALGHEDSAVQDSFSDDRLDYPHYTRPELVADKAIPEVLKSGNHKAVLRWRLKQSLGRTWQRRPDLLQKRILTAEEKKLLDEFIAEQ